MAVHEEDEGAGPVEEALGEVTGAHALPHARPVVVRVPFPRAAPRPSLPPLSLGRDRSVPTPWYRPFSNYP